MLITEQPRLSFWQYRSRLKRYTASDQTSPLSGIDPTAFLQVYSKTLHKTLKTSMIINGEVCYGLMAQQVKAFAPKPDDLGLIPETHMAGEN